MAYTTVDDPELYFQTKIWTGNGASSRSHTFDGTSDMQPDWVWIKDRDQNNNHQTFDSVRGVTKTLQTDRDIAEGTVASMLTAFGSDGFTTGDHSSMNDNNVKYASWSWKAGTAFSNDASATSIGTIDSSGSVNDTAGFSIVIRTGTGSAGTIKHGLSTVPKMIITKMRNDAESWGVYNVIIGNTKYLKLDSTEAEDSSSGVWNDTTPTTSVFSVGNSALVNGSSKTYVDYVFSEIKGYSKFGKYIGNGNADGTFAFLGFKPAFVMVRDPGNAENWLMYDNKRPGYNLNNNHFFANASDVETASSANTMDLLSTGFKVRSSNNGLTGWAKIGTGMTESSGVFSFPRTGLYSVRAHASFILTTDDTGCKFQTYVTLNNSSYSQVAEATSGITDSTSTVQGAYSESLVNVTDISNVKVKFVLASAGTDNGMYGSNSFQRTGVFFERKGVSQ